jgi:hypothetical protein
MTAKKTSANSGKTGMKKKMPTGKRFQKGVSGNPLGRPSTKPITDAYKRVLDRRVPGDPEKRTFGEMLAESMVRIACNPKLAAQAISAAAEICDRLEGKAVARQELSGKDGGPLEFKQMNREETERRVFALLAKAKIQVVSGKVP